MVLFRFGKVEERAREKHRENTNPARQAGDLSSEPLLSPWYIYLVVGLFVKCRPLTRPQTACLLRCTRVTKVAGQGGCPPALSHPSPVIQLQLTHIDDVLRDQASSPEAPSRLVRTRTRTISRRREQRCVCTQLVVSCRTALPARLNHPFSSGVPRIPL